MFRGCYNPNVLEVYSPRSASSPQKSYVSYTMASSLKLRKINYKSSPYQIFSANNPLGHHVQASDIAYSWQTEETLELIPRADSKTDVLDISVNARDVRYKGDETTYDLHFNNRTYKVYRNSSQYQQFGQYRSIEHRHLPKGGRDAAYNQQDAVSLHENQFASLHFDEFEEQKLYPAYRKHDAVPVQVLFASGGHKPKKAELEAAASLNYNEAARSEEKVAAWLYDSVEKPPEAERTEFQAYQCCEDPEEVLTESLAPMSNLERISARSAVLSSRSQSMQASPAKSRASELLGRSERFPRREAKSYVSYMEYELLSMQYKYCSPTYAADPVAQKLSEQAAATDLAAISTLRIERVSQPAVPILSPKYQLQGTKIDVKQFSSVRMRIQQIQQKKKAAPTDVDLLQGLVSRKPALYDATTLKEPRQKLEDFLQRPDSPEARGAALNGISYRLAILDHMKSETVAANKESYPTRQHTGETLERLIAESLSPARGVQDLRILRETPVVSAEGGAMQHIEAYMRRMQRGLKAETPRSLLLASREEDLCKPAGSYSILTHQRVTKSNLSSFDYSCPSTQLVVNIVLHCVSALFRYGKYDSYHLDRIRSQKRLDFGSVAYFINALENYLIQMVVDLETHWQTTERRIGDKLARVEEHYEQVAFRARGFRRWKDEDASPSSGVGAQVQSEYEMIQAQYRELKRGLLDVFY